MNASYDRRSAPQPQLVTDDSVATSPSPTPFAGPGSSDAANTPIAGSEQDDIEPPREICRPDPKRYVAIGSSELSETMRSSAFYSIAPRKEGLQLFFGRSQVGAGSTAMASGSKRPEPQFQCKICGHSFGRIGKLRSHELVHSKEKPFECKVCGRRFRQRGTLVQHERIHYPERAYQCRICMKNLTRWSILETHMLKIHKVQLNGNPPSAEPSSTSAAGKPGDNAQSH